MPFSLIGVIAILSWLRTPSVQGAFSWDTCGTCSQASVQCNSLTFESFSALPSVSIAYLHRSSRPIRQGTGNFAPACFLTDRKITYLRHAVLWEWKMHSHCSHFPLSTTAAPASLWCQGRPYIYQTPGDTCQRLLKTLLLSSWYSTSWVSRSLNSASAQLQRDANSTVMITLPLLIKFHEDVCGDSQLWGFSRESEKMEEAHLQRENIKPNHRKKQGFRERVKSWLGLCLLFCLFRTSFTSDFPGCSYMRQGVFLSFK